jgi:hypothetical protein
VSNNFLKDTNSTNLYEGKIVLIFDDPVSKKHLEGKATLIEPFIKNQDMEFWMVSFWSKPEAITFRWVTKDE